MVEILTAEQVTDLLNDTGPHDVYDLADSHEALRAKLAEAEKEITLLREALSEETLAALDDVRDVE